MGEGTTTGAPAGLELVESRRCHGGEQRVYAHQSSVLGCRMRFALFLPDGWEGRDLPVLTFLSGLTCTEQNVITKGGAQRDCADHDLILLCPDTSPRGEEVADDEGWDLGQGAGFYLTATEAPWAAHYRMDRYVLEELPALLQSFTTSESWGITGHSMGGHGALVLALRNPGRFRSVSALAPILTPSAVPWGEKAFTAYLGPDRARWAEWDATALLARAAAAPAMRIDQGGADPFLEAQLDPAAFLEVVRAGGHPVEYHQHPGYDHSYYFVASFLPAHVAWHAAQLR